jgi:hypothetical protein
MPYYVRGTIVENETGTPLPGLYVRAYDKDLVIDDFLGDTVTDGAGAFEIVFTEVQFMDAFETQPDLYLRVFDPSGRRELLSTHRAVRSDAGPEEHFDLRIPAAKLA